MTAVVTHCTAHGFGKWHAYKQYKGVYCIVIRIVVGCSACYAVQASPGICIIIHCGTGNQCLVFRFWLQQLIEAVHRQLSKQHSKIAATAATTKAAACHTL